MEYIVSARKYRPMTFDSVVGQGALTTTLKNAVKSGKLAHAYLFCGPRGVGKTTCARIFARAINCQSPSENGDACGQCESCRSFEEQRSFNIFELDAASNNGVEDIKTLMEQTRIPPQVGRYKVFIIDEVHMLSTAAFNAFLKTLEEPPAHVVFILATTEKHKLLPTIISRCQIYDFERMNVQNTINHLKMVAEKEGYTYEEAALAVIAEKADGGMRDALSIFDQAASFCQGNITYDKVIEDLNVLDTDNYFKIVDLALANKVSDILLLLNKVIEKGFDAGNMAQGLASHIRNVMLAKDTQTLPLLEVSDQQKNHYAEQAKNCPPAFLYKALRLLNNCDINYRQSSNKRLLVELTLIQVAQITQPEDEGASAGRSPKRLKSLFKQIVKQAKPKKAAVQVAAAKPETVGTTPKVAPEKPVQEKPTPKPGTVGSIGITFGSLLKGGDTKDNDDNKEEEIVEEKTVDNEFFDDQQLALQWLAMCNRMEQRPEMRSLATRMTNLLPVIKDYPLVEVVVENKMLFDQVTQLKKRILATLRMYLHNQNIEIDIRMAEPHEVRPVLSKREQIEEMRQHSPSINALFNSLELEIVS